MPITPMGMRMMQAGQLIKGDKGDKGDPGKDGINGTNGVSVKGDKGEPGKDGLNGTNGKDAVVITASPVSRAIAVGGVYQASNKDKPATVSITLTSTSTVSLSGVVNNIATVSVGPTATGPWTSVGAYENTLGGALVVGLSLTNKATNTYTLMLPIGWYFTIKQTAGNGISVVSAFDQQLG